VSDCQRYIYESWLSEIVFIWQVVRTEGRTQNATTAAAESGCVINTTECSRSREIKERERKKDSLRERERGVGIEGRYIFEVYPNQHVYVLQLLVTI
jgi:hypothetical protein